MSLPSPADETEPNRAGKLAVILSVQPGDSQPSTQFNAEQRQAYEWAIAWIHDFNLGRRPKPDFSDEVLGRLSDFHETRMNEHFRQKEPVAEPSLIPADDQREGLSHDDPLAEWTQRMLVGMKRMTEDPEYRASIKKRIS